MDDQIISQALSINFYRKSVNCATLVFKANQRVHRFPTISNAALLTGMLKGYERNLRTNSASNKFAFRVDCGKEKNRIVEIKLDNQSAKLTVNELTGEEFKLCFAWTGSKGELSHALGDFRRMASREWLNNVV